jgi:hypothetical protein
MLLGVLEEYYEIDLKDRLDVCSEKKLTNYLSGWEDSTMGNIFFFFLLPYVIKGDLKVSAMKSDKST